MDRTCKYSKDCGHEHCPSVDCPDYEDSGIKPYNSELVEVAKLIEPMLEYFHIQDQLETGEYDDDLYGIMNELMYRKNIESRKNIMEIKKHLLL